MTQRRWLRSVIGAVAVLVGMSGVASIGWQLFSRHREPIGPLWTTIAVLAASAVVLYFGVHLIFGAPSKNVQQESWDSRSAD